MLKIGILVLYLNSLNSLAISIFNHTITQNDSPLFNHRPWSFATARFSCRRS